MNSKYYDRETDMLSPNAPIELKEEQASYNRLIESQEKEKPQWMKDLEAEIAAEEASGE
jgi:hypothetical protein